MAVAIAVTRERREGETRCAVTPETVRKLADLGATVTVEAGTGLGSSIPDDDYVVAGASVRPDLSAVLAGADLSRAVLHGAQVKQADFTGAQTGGARGLDPADLKAA